MRKKLEKGIRYFSFSAVLDYILTVIVAVVSIVLVIKIKSLETRVLIILGTIILIFILLGSAMISLYLSNLGTGVSQNIDNIDEINEKLDNIYRILKTNKSLESEEIKAILALNNTSGDITSSQNSIKNHDAVYNKFIFDKVYEVEYRLLTNDELTEPQVLAKFLIYNALTSALKKSGDDLLNYLNKRKYRSYDIISAEYEKFLKKVNSMQDYKIQDEILVYIGDIKQKLEFRVHKIQ